MNKNTKSCKPNGKANAKHHASYKKRAKYPHNYDPEDKLIMSDKHNDISWYVKDQQLLKDVASLPFSSMLGNGVATSSQLLGPVVAYNTDKYVYPGIMTIVLEQSLGSGILATDASTVAARNIYSFVRHANSGSANYEAPDLMMMIIAHSSASAFIESLKRVYGTLMNYSVRNRYYAESVVKAMGFDYQDLLANMANFRAYINQASARLNTIKIPGQFALAERWKWLASQSFVDDQGEKPQLYVPVFGSYYKFDGYGSETGTQLLTVDTPYDKFAVGNSLFTVDSAIAFCEDLLAPLLSEEDVGIMSGDIIKAYGESVSQIELIPTDYIALPKYDESALVQIMNSIAYPSVSSQRPTCIQEEGVIVDKHFVSESAYHEAIILNSHNDNVTPEEAMIMTRLSGGEIVPQVDGTYLITRTGSEIVRGYYIYVLDVDGPYRYWFNDNFYYFDPRGENPDILTDVMISQITKLSNFDWHPRVYWFSKDPVADVTKFVGTLGDVDNYSTVTTRVIGEMNNVAILGELNSTSKTSVR